MLGLFISQPMRERTPDEIIKERQDVFYKAIDKGIKEGIIDPDESVRTVDSYFPKEYVDEHEKNKGIKYLGRSLMMMAESDVVVMAKGWENARGCKIEHDTAIAYGIPVIYID